MAEKQTKVIEICFAGSNSLAGGIFNEFGIDLFKEVDTYRWVVCVNYESFSLIEEECIRLKINDYIIVERRNMIVSKK